MIPQIQIKGLDKLPSGFYVIAIERVDDMFPSSPLVSCVVQKNETIRHRLQIRGWREGRGRHLYKEHGGRMWRAVFMRSIVKIDVLSTGRNHRGRRDRIRIAGARYTDVKLIEDNSIVIGSTRL